MMDEALLTFNGIDATTGAYLLPPKTLAELAANLSGERTNPQDPHFLELQKRDQARKVGDRHLGVKEGVDPKNLAEAGWGVVFPHDADPAIPEALQELFDWRQAQAAAHDERLFRVLRGPQGYRSGESKTAFLQRLGAGPGAVDPLKMPYYLLVVGSPEAIPFRFQTQLDVQYAVGRLHFDRPEDYAHYARSVVAAERDAPPLPKRAAFFGVANPDDRATRLSAGELVAPLAESVARDQPGWAVQSYLREAATKSALAALLGGPQTPALLFTAGHGLGFPPDDPRQLQRQGALLCGDWPGPRRGQGPVQEEHYFSAGDLGEGAHLAGLLAFFFACYGAGTPRLDEFTYPGEKARAELAPQAFLAGLPQRMLAHPNGGALAVVGHVDRAWGYSFSWGQAGRQLAVFESALKRLMEGHPVGSAMEYFNERYAELSSDLSVLLENIGFGEPYSAAELAGMWTANNDARNYLVLGDPAVRLRVGEAGGLLRPQPAVELSSRKATVPPSEPDPAAPAPTPDESVEHDTIIHLHAGLPSVTFSKQPRQTGRRRSETSAENPPKAPPAAGEIDAALQELSARLARLLSESLEVATYTAADLDALRSSGDLSAARLRVLTRLDPDGNAQLLLPETPEALDAALWAAHRDVLELAQANRRELLKLSLSFLNLK